jgi:dTDP-4-dehydrorhamnose reductase
MTSKDILITGANGMVGSYANFGVRLGRTELDVTDGAAVRAAFEKHKPSAVIHLSALTDQTACDTNPTQAYMVNAIGAYHVALAARRIGAQMVYVSTNAVFNGRGEKPFNISDTPDPQNSYGRSKYAGECLVREVLPDALIVRTSWVFGGGPTKDKKFVGTIARKLQSDTSEIKTTADVIGTPTYGKDLMEMIVRLISEKKTGVIHLTNAGTASRHDMALFLKEILNSSVNVAPIDAASFGGSVVHNEALAGETMRPWRDALREYIETEWGISRG